MQTGGIDFLRQSPCEAILLHAGLAQLADSPVADPQQHFTVNQSVRASIVSVDTERGRFSLALKHSLTGPSDGLYVESLFASLEAAERIRWAAHTCNHGFCKTGLLLLTLSTIDTLPVHNWCRWSLQ